VESILQAVTQDLTSLQQGVIGQLSRDVARLHAEKLRLIADIEKLQAYHQTLQSWQLETLSQQQIAQQQLWAKQLAQVLSSHLQALMIQRLNQLANPHQASSSTQPHVGTSLATADSHSDHAHRLLASLDSSFSTTFKALQQDLNSYQSSLSQQLNRMQSLEQQGEAILEALIQRLREQLQMEASRSVETHLPHENGYPRENGYATEGSYLRDGGYPSAPTGYSSAPANGGANPLYPSLPPPLRTASGHPYPPSPQLQVPPTAQPIPLEAPGAPLPLPTTPKKELSHFQIGLVLVLISTAALSIHNVVVRIIGRESVILGWLGGGIQLGGFIQLSLGNSLLILWLRMLVVLPLMIPVAMFLYPPVWRDLKRFLTAPDRRPLFNVVGSGVFLFLSQVLIYMAIGKIGAGPAVTILFMYPIVTVPLAWFLFGDRPTPLRWIVMFTILLGVIFTALPRITSASDKLSNGGAFVAILIAVASGIAFAFYLICMQLGFKKLHPIPVTLIQFSTIFVLSSVILTFAPPTDVQVDQPLGFLLGGILLGALTLVGYLTNNFGVRYMGAALASIVASSGPVVTALLAILLINDPLQQIQVFGILLVTLGVGALSFERMKSQRQAAARAAKA
jgi:drug/metabolite transporter (DMT)-like permease